MSKNRNDFEFFPFLSPKISIERMEIHKMTHYSYFNRNKNTISSR